jgi:hypothetical protein
LITPQLLLTEDNTLRIGTTPNPNIQPIVVTYQKINRQVTLSFAPANITNFCGIQVFAVDQIPLDLLPMFDEAAFADSASASTGISYSQGWVLPGCDPSIATLSIRKELYLGGVLVSLTWPTPCCVDNKYKPKDESLSSISPLHKTKKNVTLGQGTYSDTMVITYLTA